MSTEIRRHVVFSHGQHSSPFSRKILALYEIAEAEGYHAAAVDYRGIDDPEERVLALSDFCKDLSGELVLVGSSLGGYVATAASSFLHARGVFLMAPALYLEPLPPLRPRVVDCPVEIVHGWHDDVVPLEHSMRFAREYGAALHVLDDDHRLHGSIRRIKHLFEYFLIAIDLPPELAA
jgi:pimeloyl-ACP methyl ester carboxylesterase